MTQSKEEKHEYYVAWRARNKEKLAEYERNRRKKARAKEGFSNREWERHLKQRYGISGEQYLKMFVDQGGVCKLCGRTPGKIKLHTDHCHATGKVRGLLCHQCNWYMGKIDKDPEIIERIKMYREDAA